jgi:arylsulfatase B
VNDAIAWTAAQGTNNWVLWLGLNAPHSPFHKPPNALHSYTNLPPNPGASTRPYFEAMVEAMDTEIGRLMTNINLTNTTVIFIGDNGTSDKVIQPPYSTNHAKGTLYEGGTRVPLIIAGAGVSNPGRESTTLVHCVDLYATILELAGVNLALTLPNSLTFDSQSLLPILTNGVLPAARATIGEYFATAGDPALVGRFVKGARYKLIEFRNGTNEFYDLLNDQLETTNLLAGGLSPSQANAFSTLTNRSAQLQDHPRLNTARSTNAVSIAFKPVQLNTYTLQYVDGFPATNWVSLVSTTALNSDVNVSFADAISFTTNRFYRVDVEPQ